jgi:hypothetical protein
MLGVKPDWGNVNVVSSCPLFSFAALVFCLCRLNQCGALIEFWSVLIWSVLKGIGLGDRLIVSDSSHGGTCQV